MYMYYTYIHTCNYWLHMYIWTHIHVLYMYATIHAHADSTAEYMMCIVPVLSSNYDSKYVYYFK